MGGAPASECESLLQGRGSGGGSTILGLQTPWPGELRPLSRKPAADMGPRERAANPKGHGLYFVHFCLSDIQARDLLFSFTFGHLGSGLSSTQSAWSSVGCPDRKLNFRLGSRRRDISAQQNRFLLSGTWPLVPRTGEGHRREAGSGDPGVPLVPPGFAGRPFAGSPSPGLRPPETPFSPRPRASNSVTAEPALATCPLIPTGPLLQLGAASGLWGLPRTAFTWATC